MRTDRRSSFWALASVALLLALTSHVIAFAMLFLAVLAARPGRSARARHSRSVDRWRVIAANERLEWLPTAVPPARSTGQVDLSSHRAD